AARSVAAILEEGVSGTGASRNAYAAGYRIAAKTGTSEKLDKLDANGGHSLRIGSCVGFAPYDNPEIAMIIVVDEPTTAHYGATVAAPYISRVMSVALPYLGYEPQYAEKEKEMRPVTIGNYIGKTVKEAKKALSELGISADFGGAAPDAIVTAQVPLPGSTLNASLGRVLLHTGKSSVESSVVPELHGLSVQEAVTKLLNAGLNIRLAGTQHTPGGGTVYPKAASQSIASGTAVPRGTVVTVTFLYDDKE
ncbi:MAG: PASTA domain-containing protein, partial [Clostridia bacterium]|nr:PASTA domain-containing protein [Clostridia bacterium]